MRALVAIIQGILGWFGRTAATVWLGYGLAQKRQQEADNAKLKKQADIAARPDLTRDELYKRMRDRNDGDVPRVPGPAVGGGGDDVRD